MKKHFVVLSLGSNCGDRRENVRMGARWISALLSDIRCSDIYETEEVHGKGVPYMNAVLSGYCELSYDILNREIKLFERSSGRDEFARAEGRVPIDIDIVIWNDEIIRKSDYSHNFFQRGFSLVRDLR